MNTSIADMIAQFSAPAPMSSPDAAKPAPMPVAPMAPAAPAAPPGGGGGNNFGGMLQKSLPMILALVARKQGGPLAGAGLLEGYARGQMQRKQAEDEALQLELQTIENAEVRAARKAEHDRKRLMERESWVRTLQEDLAKINDPEQFASFLSSAEKYGAPIHGIQPGELAQRFTFPDSRVAEAARTRAQARIDALRKANPNNFDDMLRANAVDSATGKPLQELMATAELLVTDQAGAPMLPTPKDDLQIPNSDRGFDFRVELAKEEEKLGRKLKPGERSALNNRLKAEDAARQRSMRVSRGSGGGSGSGGGMSPAQPVGAAIEADSQDILSHTGLSYNAFMVLTGRTSQLGRDSVTRNKAMTEAQAWARRRGTDISTLASQYKAYNETLEANIQRFNRTQMAEGEIAADVENLIAAANESGLGDVRAINAAKQWLRGELNDPGAAQYAFFLNQLTNDIALYNAASQGRAALQSDQDDAKGVVQRGIASGSLQGMQRAITASVEKMGAVLEGGVNRSRRNVWNLFGVGDKYKPSGSTPPPSGRGAGAGGAGLTYEDYLKSRKPGGGN